MDKFKDFNGKSILFSLFLMILHTSSFASSLAIESALEKKLYDSHVWKALLHVENDKPKIYNQTFLLTYNDFSLKNELVKTIIDFENGKNICKFPARYLWLKNQLPNNEFKSFRCEKFDEYIEKTNPDELELIFASENVSSPSSMMGHIFFNIKSKNDNGKIKQNAVSFFTVIDTLNIPLLITKSTITGMKGYFILSPYRRYINKYLYEEQRTIWEYKLNLSEYEKELVLYHFWELKDIDMTYYFTGFNCATLIDDILSITSKEYKNESALWVTPKDVIKNAEKKQLIKSTKMIPSIEWELKMLSENMDMNKIKQIMQTIEEKRFNNFNKRNFFSKNAEEEKLEKQFIFTYSKYLLSKNEINMQEYERILGILENDEYIIKLENYKNPIKTFDDTQFSLYYLKKEEDSFMGIVFLPASNTIYDDNREYFSETSLKIGEIDLEFNKNKIHLNSINFYDMKSLIPWNNVTNDISKQFNISYQKHYTNSLDDFKVLNLSGGLGLTKKIHNDVWLYGLGNLGMGVNFNTTYPYTFLESGIIIYELFNMKTVLTHTFIYNQDNSDTYYQDLSINQALFFHKKVRFDIKYEEKFNDKFKKNELMFKFNYFF